MPRTLALLPAQGSATELTTGSGARAQLPVRQTQVTRRPQVAWKEAG